MSRKQQGDAALIIVVVLLVVVILGLIGLFFWRSVINAPSSDASNITTYEECKVAPGSIFLETYPEQCVTVDGKTFTAPIEQPQ